MQPQIYVMCISHLNFEYAPTKYVHLFDFETVIIIEFQNQKYGFTVHSGVRHKIDKIPSPVKFQGQNNRH